MKIAVTGKGGVGKTTFAATLARLYAEEGRHVLAADVDPDANLGLALGFSEEELEEICSLMLKSGVNPEYPLYPCHCCDLKSKIIMSKFFNVQEVCTGDVLNC